MYIYQWDFLPSGKTSRDKRGKKLELIYDNRCCIIEFYVWCWPSYNQVYRKLFSNCKYQLAQIFNFNSTKTDSSSILKFTKFILISRIKQNNYHSQRIMSLHCNDTLNNYLFLQRLKKESSHVCLMNKLGLTSFPWHR